MAFKQIEIPHRKNNKNKKEDKHVVHRKSTLEDMQARAEQLLAHSPFYDSMKELEPFIKFVSTSPLCDIDPEGALLMLHNCLVMRTNKGFNHQAIEIVKGVQTILNDNESTGHVMTRLESAANEICGEEIITLKRADKLVGFSFKKPKNERLIRPIIHDEIEREPTKKDLAQIASNESTD